MHKATRDEKKKTLVLAIVGLFYIAGLAVVVNQNRLALYRSDIYLRWYAVDKLFSEDRNLYDSRNGEEVTRLAWGEGGFPWNVNFYYPAHLVTLVGPLALLPYPVAHLVWTVAGQAFFLAGVWLAMRLVRWPGSINKQTAFIVAATLSIPHIQHVIWGQFNTIAVLCLVLCLYALRQGRYGLAGIWAVGLTFKPHISVLTVVFLLLWALFKRERWRFYLGFGVTALAMWAIAELLQPGWVPTFLRTLGGYGTTSSVLDLVWNPHQIVAGLLCLGALFLFLRNGRISAASPAFAGCLVLSVALWFLIVPVVGMMHVVLLPVAFVMLLASLQGNYPTLYSIALYSLILLYILGILGFVWGLSSPELYGKHIEWSEYAYKVAAPILVALFSVPLCVIPVRGEGTST